MRTLIMQYQTIKNSTSNFNSCRLSDITTRP